MDIMRSSPKVQMTWTDAAEKVLRREKEPIDYNELAKKILDAKLVETQGKTPAIAMYSTILVENKSRQAKGDAPRFFIERGTVGLASWQRSISRTKLLKQVIDERDEIKLDFLKRLRQLDGSKFESYLEILLRRLGYEGVEVRGGPGDEGIDLFCQMSQGINQVKTAVQAKCKQAHNKIGPKDVRLLRDVLPKFKCSQGVLITTSAFTKQAQEAATEEGRLPIILIDGEKLAELALEHEVGIKAQSVKVYSVDPEFELFKNSKRKKNSQPSDSPLGESHAAENL